jgi:hypothetical protein
MAKADAEHERVIRALYEESEDEEEFITKVLLFFWSKYKELQRDWPDKEEYLQYCVPAMLSATERESFDDKAFEEAFVLPLLKRELLRIREALEAVRRAWPDEGEYLSSCLPRALEVYYSKEAWFRPAAALRYILFGGREQGAPA